MADAADPIARPYSPFSEWMGSLWNEDYKSKEKTKAELETEDAESDSTEEEVDDGYLPLSFTDMMRKASLISLAKINISYAIAQEMVFMRDFTIADSDANILKKASYYVITPIALALMSVCVVIEAVVRKIIGMALNVFALCRPPAPTDEQKEADEAEDAKSVSSPESSTEADETEKEEKKDKTLFDRHVEFFEKHAERHVELNSAISLAIFAIGDLVNTIIASLNPFHATSDIKPSIAVTGVWIPFALSSVEGVSIYATRTFEVLSDFHDKGKKVDYFGKQADGKFKLYDQIIPLSLVPGVSTLYGMARSAIPHEHIAAYAGLLANVGLLANNENKKAMAELFNFMRGLSVRQLVETTKLLEKNEEDVTDPKVFAKAYIGQVTKGMKTSGLAIVTKAFEVDLDDKGKASQGMEDQ